MTSPPCTGNLFDPSLTRIGWYLAAHAGCGWVLRGDGALRRRLLEIRGHVTGGPRQYQISLHDLVATWRGRRDGFQIAERRMSLFHPPLPASGCKLQYLAANDTSRMAHPSSFAIAHSTLQIQNYGHEHQQILLAAGARKYAPYKSCH